MHETCNLILQDYSGNHFNMDTNLHIQKLYSKPSYRLPHTEPPQQMAPQRIESQFKPVRDLQQIKKKLIQIKLIAYNTPYSSHELNFLFNEIIYVEYPLFLIFMPLFKEERTYCFAAVCRLVSQSTNSFRSFFFCRGSICWNEFGLQIYHDNL